MLLLHQVRFVRNVKFGLIQHQDIRCILIRSTEPTSGPQELLCIENCSLICSPLEEGAGSEGSDKT